MATAGEEIVGEQVSFDSDAMAEAVVDESAPVNAGVQEQLALPAGEESVGDLGNWSCFSFGPFGPFSSLFGFSSDPLLEEVVRDYLDRKKCKTLDAETIRGIATIVNYLLELQKAKKEEAAQKRAAKQKRRIKKQKRRIRKPGGGRKKIESKHPYVYYILFYLLDSVIYGNPEKPLYWTDKSLAKLSAAMLEYGIEVSGPKIADMMHEMGFSAHKNKKFEQVGKIHPDAKAQMDYLVEKLKMYTSDSYYAVISIDCKKKENVGNYANNGSEYSLNAVEVNSHDFCDKKVAPYGVYDINHKFGFINLGVSSDTAEFSVHSIEKWWNLYGKAQNPDAKTLVITADGGGSNASRSRLFKLKLQELANKLGMILLIHHYPPGKSKYNKIEHQLFCHISNNWRARPLETIPIILELIRATKTLKGLRVEASLDNNTYETGIKVSKEELGKVLIVKDSTLGQWNYKIFPESMRKEYEEIVKQEG